MIRQKATIKKIKNTLVVADDPNDVGVAALLSVLQYHGTYSTIEHLRILSGSNESGSTLFGLQQAAIKYGYQCKGYKLDTEALKECTQPVILSMSPQQQDFAVFYGVMTIGNQPMYVVKDSLKGLVYLNQRQLTKLWMTNFCLVIEPPADNKVSTPLPKLSVLGLLKKSSLLLFAIVFLALLSSALLLWPSAHFLTNFISIWSLAQSNDLIITAAVVIVAFCAALLLESYRKRLAVLYVIPIQNNVSERFYTAFGHLPKLFFESYRSESLAKYNGQLQELESALAFIMKKGVLGVAITIVGISLFAYFSPITLLVLLPLAFVYCWWLAQSSKVLAKDQLRKNLLQSKSNVLFIEACEIHRKAYEKDRETRFNSRIKQVSSFGLYSNFMQDGKKDNHRSKAALFCFAIFLCAALLNGYFFFSGALSASDFTVVMAVCVVMAYTLTSAHELFFNISVGNASLEQITQMEFTAKQTADGQTRIEAIEAVEVSELGFLAISFNRPIVKSASFTIEKGCITGVIGANGSGKSTIAEILMKHYGYSTGTIKVNNRYALHEVATGCWNDLVAIVPQQPAIFPGRLLENVTMTDARHNIDEVIAFLREFRLDAFFQQFPKGELTSIGTANITLSPAQQQIICIARALYSRPQLLILDDFAQHLDAQMLEYAFFMIQKAKAHTAIVLLTSNMALADKCCDKKFYL